MAQPFFMQYETELNGMHGCQDSFHQFLNVENLMRIQLLDCTIMAMMNPAKQSGQIRRPAVLRASGYVHLGWFMASLVETDVVMNEALYYEYRYLQKMLKDAADAVLKVSG
jgi:unsaturated rhamnogalacturonyl hydrolase